MERERLVHWPPLPSQEEEEEELPLRLIACCGNKCIPHSHPPTKETNQRRDSFSESTCKKEKGSWKRICARTVFPRFFR